MAIDPWMIDASAGVPAYTAGEVRLMTVVPMFAGAGASLGVRSGVRQSGSGTDLLVQAQVSPNMTVKVNTGVAVVQGAISTTQGAYTWALDTVTNLTIAAAHATLTRTDLVVVRIRDAGVDTSGQRDGAVTVITGTAGGGVPSLPTDATYFTLAQIAVGAAVTTIIAGNITDRRTFTAALGGIFACNAATEPAATSLPVGSVIYRTDLDTFKSTNGTRWSNRLEWSSAWGIVGGRDYGGAGTVLSSGISTTEFAPGNADTTAVSLIAGRRYALNYLFRGIRSATGDIETRIRDTNVSGAVRLYQHSYAMNGAQSYPLIGSGRYTCATNETKTFVFTINTLGTGTVDVYREGGGYFEVMDIGPASTLIAT